MAHAVKIVLLFMCSESIISKKWVKKRKLSVAQGRKQRKEEEQKKEQYRESQVNHCVLAHDVYAVFWNSLFRTS